jgi:hypothetical protein
MQASDQAIVDDARSQLSNAIHVGCGDEIFIALTAIAAGHAEIKASNLRVWSL